MEYQMIQNTNPAEFCRYATEALRNGWKPLGGVSTCITHNGIQVYTQAFVLDSKTAES